MDISENDERPSGLSFNLIIVSLAFVMMFSYVFLANYLVSQKYVASARRLQFHQLSSAQSSGAVVAQENDADLKDVMAYAQKSGMVEAKNTDAIFEDSGVAMSR